MNAFTSSRSIDASFLLPTLYFNLHISSSLYVFALTLSTYLPSLVSQTFLPLHAIVSPAPPSATLLTHFHKEIAPALDRIGGVAAGKVARLLKTIAAEKAHVCLEVCRLQRHGEIVARLRIKTRKQRLRLMRKREKER